MEIPPASHTDRASSSPEKPQTLRERKAARFKVSTVTFDLQVKAEHSKCPDFGRLPSFHALVTTDARQLTPLPCYSLDELWK